MQRISRSVLLNFHYELDLTSMKPGCRKCPILPAIFLLRSWSSILLPILIDDVRQLSRHQQESHCNLRFFTALLTSTLDNPLTGENVLVSPHRTKRPWQGQTEPPQTATLPEYDPQCYLCPGNKRSGGQQNDKYEQTMVSICATSHY